MFMKIRALPDPEVFKQEFAVSKEIQKKKKIRDDEIKKIFTGEDDRFILVVGPCSADDSDAVCDYVTRLAKVEDKVKDKIMLIPRIYTNKPRTSGIGYKGMLHQPSPEKDSNIYQGLISIRKMHLKALSATHLTAADEMLYPENIAFFDDLLSYHAVGARSVGNQQHRLAASGIDEPVGMKNPTSGDLSVMFNSILAAQSQHIFLYRQEEVKTTSNPLAHAILRGSVNKHGENIPNYHYEDLLRTTEMYQSSGLQNPAVLVDLNHSNSNKQHTEQVRIAKEVLNSRNYNPDIKKMVKGFMIESYIVEGSRSIDNYTYGKSITDPCLGWEDTEKLIYTIAETV